MSGDAYLGCGIYTLRDAARLLKIKQRVLRQWVGETATADSVIARRLSEDQLLTFPELMELHFIKMFRDEDVSFQAIRRAAQAASKKFGTDYPFAVKRFDTDGRTIFATLQGRETEQEIIEDLQHGQLVFTKIIRPFFKRLDYCGTHEIERYWPLGKSGRIVLDPARRFGKPIDANTGVPTDAIMNAINAGGGQDLATVAQWFEIPADAVTAAIRFERSLAN